MAVFYKLALIATAALAMVSAAPITTPATTLRHTTAKEITLTTESTHAEDPTLITAAGSFFSGVGTWFTDTVGSCGTPFDTNDMIVAMNAAQQQGTAQCGRSVKITHGGKSVTARVVDTCPSQFCNSGSLDLSQAVFKTLAPLDEGVIDIKWEFV